MASVVSVFRFCFFVGYKPGTMRTKRRSKLTIIYDLETTGFCPMPKFSNYSKVVQICALCVETGEMFMEFVNPYFKGGIPSASTLIHNIKAEHVDNAPPIDLVLERMYRFFCFNKYDIVELIAHNNSKFDELILMKEYKTVKNSYLPDNVVFWDSIIWLRDNYMLESYALGNVYKHFYGENFDNAHRADEDVKALHRIYVDHILPYRRDEQTEEEITRNRVYSECLTSLQFIGPWRADMCYYREGIQTVSQLVQFAQGLIAKGDNRAFDRWLRDTLGIRNIDQRYFVVSKILDIPVWFDEIREFINLEGDEDCIDCVDYYVKYRYVLNKRAPNQCMYNRGLMNAFHKVN